MISDSEVLDAITIIKSYAEQVKEERRCLYCDAMNSSNVSFANSHLRRFQSATYLEQQCQIILQLYKDTK